MEHRDLGGRVADRFVTPRGIVALLVFSTILLWIITAVPPVPATTLVVWQCVGAAEPAAGRVSFAPPLVRLYPQRGPPGLLAS